jgi:hypothetical protein
VGGGGCVGVVELPSSFFKICFFSLNIVHKSTSAH